MSYGEIYPFDNCDYDCGCRPCDKTFLMIASSLSSLDKRLLIETDRREEADKELHDKIVELVRLSSDELKELTDAINAEIARAKASETAISTNVDALGETVATLQDQVTANSTELAKTKWKQMVIDLQ